MEIYYNWLMVYNLAQTMLLLFILIEVRNLNKKK